MTIPEVPKPKRIVLIRLDRIGDVVLSTPVIQQLRQRFPKIFIAMMVRPICRELVEGHPDLNTTIVYDKDGAHRRLKDTLHFARALKRYAFDTALALHPSNRSHWIPWLAGIPVRVGYNRKYPWLLTHRIPHQKQEGTLHEAAYTLQFLRCFSILPEPPLPAIPVSPQAQLRLGALLDGFSVKQGDPLVVIHPSASCVSKRWMSERFAQVGDRLITRYGVKVCIVAGADDVSFANAVQGAMKAPAVNLAGRLTPGDLAALLQRAGILLSNDSGPVHVAAAVGTPVVTLFGRNQTGLSPRRWGPLGEGHIILHKDVGCVTCLAHACDIDFRCLKSLSVDEVTDAASSIVERRCRNVFLDKKLE